VYHELATARLSEWQHFSGAGMGGGQTNRILASVKLRS
jgi:hypothetical protein